MKVIISGGGSGGHVFSAISIAEAYEKHIAENAETPEKDFITS